MVRQIGVLLLAATTLTVGACGASDDEPPPREGRNIPKAQLIAEGDAICRQSDTSLAEGLPKVPGPEGTSANVTAIAPYLELNAKTLFEEVAQISALGIPHRDADVLDDYLNRRRTTARSLRDSAQAARAGQFSELEAALEATALIEARALARRFGFKVCAQAAPPPLG